MRSCAVKGQRPGRLGSPTPIPKEGLAPEKEGYPSAGTRQAGSPPSPLWHHLLVPPPPSRRIDGSWPPSGKGGASQSILLEPEAAPGAGTLQHHCVGLKFMVRTKLAQAVETANPSLIPPLHQLRRELPTTLSKASRLIFSPWCHSAETLCPR